MKIALITTTINIPTVLSLYRKLGSEPEFFIAGDHKTPVAAYEFCKTIPNCHFYSPQEQMDLGYRHSELIGWNTDSRRNIALLEAVKWGAEIIVSVDDDMLASEFFFGEIADNFDVPHSGLCAGVAGQWFDAGKFTIPPAAQRGLPVHYGFADAFEAVVDAPIGVHQAIILGVPDTDSLTAITCEPRVYSVTDVLRNGFVVRPDALTVFNSQLTAFRRELAPGFAQFYKWQGRNTDIFASLIMRRVMKERGLYTYFGPPMGYHARKARPLFNDLKSEMYGLEHIVELSDQINSIVFPQESVPEMVARMYYVLSKLSWFPKENCQAALSWCDDVAGVL